MRRKGAGRLNKLFYKELRLVTHPTSIMFFGLAALMLIPNYPYYVTFFYTALGVFFCCLSGRENNDIFYTAMLPVAKGDIVRARFLFACTLELVQFALAVPFALIRQSFSAVPPNQVGIEANIAFFGLAFVMMGLFNLVFFTRYYKNPDNVGKCFAVASVVMFVYMTVMEALVHAVPFMRDCIDTTDAYFVKEKLVFLFAGAAVYALLTFAAMKISVKSFQKLDL